MASPVKKTTFDARPKASKTSQNDPKLALTDIPNFVTGAGGELHQVAAEGQTRLTTNNGAIVADDHNSLKAGPRGPILLEDFVLREKIHHFDHERIPSASSTLAALRRTAISS